MAGQYPKERFHRVGFLGTMGSRASGVYRQAVEEAGYTFVEPDDELQERITSLIYDDVKGTGDLNLQRYESVLQAMLDPAGTCRCDTLMLGCTELSVLNEAFPLPQLPIIDAQAVLVEDTVSRAKASAARVGAGEKGRAGGATATSPDARPPPVAYGRQPPPAGRNR